MAYYGKTSVLGAWIFARNSFRSSCNYSRTCPLGCCIPIRLGQEHSKRRSEIIYSVDCKNAPIVKIEPIFCKKSEPILPNEPILILYPFHRLLTQKKQVQKVLAFFVLMIFKQFLDCGYRCVI